MALGIEAEVANHLRMHLPRARDLEPAALEWPARERYVDLCGWLGERKERWAETQREIVGLEEGAEEVGEDHLQVLEAHVLANPQPFALVKHRRMRGIAVDAVGSARRDHTDLGDGFGASCLALSVCAGVAHLHRRGVWPKVEPTTILVLHVDVEGVLHRPRRMVLGIVERGEAVPVRLDLGAVGDVETHRAKNRFDALERARHRMQRTRTALAPGQAHIETLFLQLGGEFGIGELLTPIGKRALDALLGIVDLRAPCTLVFGREKGQRLHLVRQTASLAEITRLGVLEFGGARCTREVGRRVEHQLFEVVHPV